MAFLMNLLSALPLWWVGYWLISLPRWFLVQPLLGYYDLCSDVRRIPGLHKRPRLGNHSAGPLILLGISSSGWEIFTMPEMGGIVAEYKGR